MNTETVEHEFHLRCEKIIHDLPLPHPFTTTAFLTELATYLGRRIELIPAPATSRACGLLVTTGSVIHVAQRPDTSPLHAQHRIVHAVSHLLLGHHELRTTPDTTTNTTTNTASTASSATASGRAKFDAVQLLLPALPPHLIRRVLGDAVLTAEQETRQEWEAETLATQIMVAIHCPAAHRVHLPIDLADYLAQPRTRLDRRQAHRGAGFGAVLVSVLGRAHEVESGNEWRRRPANARHRADDARHPHTNSFVDPADDRDGAPSHRAQRVPPRNPTVVGDPELAERWTA